MSAEYFRSPVFTIRWPRGLVGAELDRLLELPGKRQPGSGAGYGAYWDQQVEHFFREVFAAPEAAEEWKRSRTDSWSPWGSSEIPTQPDTSWLQLVREHLDDLPEPQARVPYWSLRQRTAGVPAQDPAPLSLAGAAVRIAQVVAELEETGYLAWAFGQTCVDGDEEGVLGADPAAAVHQALGRQGLWPIGTNHAQYTAGDLFDVVEFLADHVRRPTRAWPHDSFDCGWHHLDFDAVRGLQVYRWRVNEVLHASDLHVTLGETGRLERSAPAGVEALAGAVLAVPAVHAADTDELRHALEQFRGRHATVLERRHAVIALAGILERRRGLLKTELLSKDEGALFTIANGFAIRHQKADQRRDYDADLYLEWIFYWYLATIHLTNRLTARQPAGPAAGASSPQPPRIPPSDAAPAQS